MGNLRKQSKRNMASLMALGLTCWLPAAPLHAESPASRPTAATALDLNETEIDWRIAFISDRLDATKRHAQIWHWSWATVQAGSLTWQTIEAERDSDSDDRGLAITEASKSFIGLVDLFWLRPLKARHGADELRFMPQATLSQKLAKLRKAEDILERNAERANDRYGWQVHVGNVLLNFAGAGAIWATGGGDSEALISAFSGIAGGELMFWTEPEQPRRDLTDYNRLTGGMTMSEAPREWHFVAIPGGLAIARTF